jgi:hypothetical protein
VGQSQLAKFVTVSLRTYPIETRSLWFRPLGACTAPHLALAAMTGLVSYDACHSSSERIQVGVGYKGYGVRAGRSQGIPFGVRLLPAEKHALIASLKTRWLSTDAS